MLEGCLEVGGALQSKALLHFTLQPPQLNRFVITIAKLLLQLVRLLSLVLRPGC